MAVADYYNRINPDLLRALPPDARVVLEIGCGAGAMAQAYRRINPQIRYLGVEMDPDAAAIAAGRLDRVVIGDAASVDLEELGIGEGGVDCLIFGDVLEHMLDPWGTLRRLAPLLRPEGQAVACIPNVQHWTMILNLLLGRWDYQDEGLLDRTHLRFFAADQMRRMFDEAGLRVYEMRPRVFSAPDHEKFLRVMTPAVEMLGIDPSAFAVRTGALQYIVRAEKSDRIIRPLVVQTLIAEPMVCARVRVVEPDQFLGTVPGVRTVASTDAQQLGGTQPGEAKIFVRQRNVLLDGLHLRDQDTLARAGYLLVSEFDDDPRHFPQVAQNRWLTFAACHAVQTSTEALAELIRPHNPHVRVFANQIGDLPDPRPPRPDGPVTLFFGALNREPDWATIIEPLNRVLEAFGNRVRVQVVYDRGFFDALATPFKEFEPFCPYDRYRALLGAADVALLPLEPSPFNLCKSDLKFIECAACGAVALAGPTVYADTIRDGETGVIFANPKDFETHLITLIEDHAGRRRIADAAYRYVLENRMLSAHFHKRLDWYRELIERLPELDRDLRRRVPELGQAILV